MNIDEINSFLTIAKSNSMTEAAELLHITQPALSNRVIALEKEIGGKLFIRGKGQRNIVLTDLGTDFFLIAERWADLWAETEALSTYGRSETLNVTTGKTSSIYIMPRVYSKFVTRGFPIRLQLKESHYLESYKLVENKKADLAFVSGIMAYKNVSTIPIYSERMVFVCSKRCGYTGSISPKDLDPHKCFDTDWSPEYRQWHRYWFGTSNTEITGTNLRLGEAIIAQNDYWAIAPLSVACSMAQNADVKFLELSEAPPLRTIYLLTLEPENKYTQLIIEDMNAVLMELTTGNKD